MVMLLAHDTFNAKDVAIMTVLETSESSLWKRKIYRQLSQQAHRLPVEGDCSVQTVGRHVDRLYEQGYIDAVPVASEEVNRALITGYRLTEEGEQSLAMARDRVLRETTISYLANAINGGDAPEANREFLQDAFARCYDVSRERLETIGKEDHLYGFLALFYSSTALREVCSQEGFREFVRELRSDTDLVSEVEEAFAPIWA